MKHVQMIAILFIACAAYSEGGGKCTHLRYPHFKINIPERPRRFRDKMIRNKMCSQTHLDICRQVFRLRFLKMIPYSEKDGLANRKIFDVFSSCCRPCGGFKNRKTFLSWQLTGYMMRDALTKNDIVYPILTYSKSSEVYGGYFIPFYNPSGVVYITKKEEFSLMKLVTACSDLWPLLVVGLSMVMIAGFIGWILDSWSNSEEFPQEFIRGWWEGIWWSFVTMTTVGYGDKAPRSIPARLFAIIWIYIGIVICGILTASLTTIIIESTTEEQPSMDGARVGVLQNRIYDAHMVVSNGGSKHTAPFCWEPTSSIFHMLQQVKDGEIDGFLLDKYTYWRWQSLWNVHGRDYMFNYVEHNATSCEHMKEIEKKVNERKRKTGEIKGEWEGNRHEVCYPMRYRQCRKGLVQFFLDKTVQQNIPHTGDEMAYGIWMKHRSHYTFFRDAFMNNQISLKSELAEENINNRKRDKPVKTIKLFAKISNYRHLFIISGGVLGVVVLFGFVFELVRRGRIKHGKPRETEENEKLHNEAVYETFHRFDW